MSNSEKIWQVMPRSRDEFARQYSEFNSVVSQLFFNRGLKEKNEIEEFLFPVSLGPTTNGAHANNFLLNPFLFNDMAAAIELIVAHIKKKNKITVYGDYDADGVTAAAVLFETLQTLKAEVDVYIPNRVSEGYGLNKKAIDEIIAMGAKLIITVDGGIRNKEEVKYAKSKGLDVIVTDHHIPPLKEEMPNCLIINPVVVGEKYPFKYLAGVGVSFKLAKALIGKSNLAENDKIKLKERVLDLVAVGTVADCVSLLGENRILVKKGLEVLNNTKRKGLLELIKVAQLNNGVNGGKRLDSWNIGFQIAPRLNAAGRMDHANTAFELLITKDEEEAITLARDLNDKNIERQKITNEIVEDIYKKVSENGEDKIIVAVSPKDNPWNEGVIGLAAGKICDKYNRPALVITRTESELKGSGRSIDGFNIIKAVEECAEFLDKYGGHPAACGFSLTEDELDGFVKKIKEVAERELAGVDLRQKIIIEAEADLSEVNERFVGEIEKFSPFGEDNERPKFLSRGAAIVDIIKMGLDSQHVKLRLSPQNGGTAKFLSAVGFWQAGQWEGLRIGDTIDIVYYIEMNEFNGRREAQLKIIDIKSHNA